MIGKTVKMAEIDLIALSIYPFVITSLADITCF